MNATKTLLYSGAVIITLVLSSTANANLCYDINYDQYYHCAPYKQQPVNTVVGIVVPPSGLTNNSNSNWHNNNYHGNNNSNNNNNYNGNYHGNSNYHGNY